MECKKCGYKLSDKTKICDKCGEKVEVVSKKVSKPIRTNDSVYKVDLDKTLNLGTILSQNSKLIKENKKDVFAVDLDKTLNLGTIKAMEKEINEYKKTTASKSNTKTKKTIIQNNVQFNKQNKDKVLKMGGIVLGAVAVLILLLSLTLGSNSSITVLEKAMNNLMVKSEKGITMDAEISIKVITGESLSASATIKAEQKENSTDIQLTLNESLFYNEMNMYATVDDKNATLYINSDTLDMFGTTVSPVSMWLYSTVKLTEIFEEKELEDSKKDINLEDIIDKEHFVYIDEVDGLKHYKLIIDQELMETLTNKVEKEELETQLEETQVLEQPVEVDFYITEANELSEIVFDLTSQLGEEFLEEASISIKFTNKDNTKVEIPDYVKTTKIDIDSYTTAYSTESEDIDLEFEY